MQTLTVTIITKNEAQDIAACIESVLWADQIIVLDSGSTDGTQAICRQYERVKLIETDWPGFGKQKQRALSLATSDWILALDADERVSAPLQEELRYILMSSADFCAYAVPRQTFFLGRKIKYSYRAEHDAPLRLVKKGVGQFSTDVVHERLLLLDNHAEYGRLKNPLQHYAFRDLDEVLRKMNHYSSLGAEKLIRQNKNCSVHTALIHAVWVFVKFYILKAGCLDGYCGFLIALSNFEGTFYRYSKAYFGRNSSGGYTSP